MLVKKINDIEKCAGIYVAKTMSKWFLDYVAKFSGISLFYKCERGFISSNQKIICSQMNTPFFS